MPRLTDQQYLQAHHQLRRFWQYAQAIYSYLAPAEQWQLHDYFQLSKDLSDQDLLAHRQAITKERPTLPHQAGKLLTKLDAAAAAWALHQQRPLIHAIVTNPHRPKGRSVVVHAIVEPELDAEAFLQVLLDLLDDDQQSPEPGLVEDHRAS